MKTEVEFRRLIDEVEPRYKRCFWDLMALRRLELRDGTEIVRFQEWLAEALHQLARFDQALAEEQRTLVGRKDAVSAKWFAKRQAWLAERRRRIVVVAGIGKALGDGFAWFFYQKERHLLVKHSALPAQPLPPPGNGGAVELQFVREVKRLGQYFVLYHGNTNMLRIGDFSLMQLNPPKVVALVEVKALERKGDVISAQLHFVGTRRDITRLLRVASAPPGREAEEGKPFEEVTVALNGAAQDRLGRQLRRMQKVLGKPKQKRTRRTTLGVEEQTYNPLLEGLLRRAKAGRFVQQHFGGGLAVAVYRYGRRSLASRLEGDEQRMRAAMSDEISRVAAATVLRQSRYNAIHIGLVGFDASTQQPYLVPGTPPLVWWDLSDEQLRQIVFQECIAVTIWNPAHLLKELEDAGFEVTKHEPPWNIVVERRVGQMRMELQQFSYFMQLISRQLHREAQVRDIIVKLTRTLGRRGFETQTRVDIELSVGLPSFRRETARGA